MSSTSNSSFQRITSRLYQPKDAPVVDRTASLLSSAASSVSGSSSSDGGGGVLHLSSRDDVVVDARKDVVEEDYSRTNHDVEDAINDFNNNRPFVPQSLAIITAKEYVPGKENVLLKGIQMFLLTSMKILNQNIAEVAEKAQEQAQSGWWFWNTTTKTTNTTTESSTTTNNNNPESTSTNKTTTATSSSGIADGSRGGGEEEEEKKCESDNDVDIKATKSGDWTPNELEGIVESMGYVLEIMQTYQKKVHKAASQYVEAQNEKRKSDELVSKVEEAAAKNKNKNTTSQDCGAENAWGLEEVAKELSAGDFLFGSILMPNQSVDEYPIGAEPIFGSMSSSSPTTDVFFGSLSSFFGGGLSSSHYRTKVDNGNLLTMDTKLQYLQDVQTVADACTTQLRELDTILSDRISRTTTGLADDGAPGVETVDSMMTNNSVLTSDVEDQAAAINPDLDEDASTYIQAARDKLAEYTDLAQDLLKDRVKCVVSEYTTCEADRTKCAPKSGASCTDDSTGSLVDNNNNRSDGLFFETLQKHFQSDAYDMDFKAYLAAESDNEMQMMLLNTLHSSLFLRNVGDACRARIRVHIGMELSVSVCDIITSSLFSGKHRHRITEWGALLFARHARALHAYVYEFCRCTSGSTDDLLIRVESSALDAPPINDNWSRLFSATDILKIERLTEYEAEMLHPLYTIDDARRILRLRADFDDAAIEEILLSSYKNSNKSCGDHQSISVSGHSYSS